MKSTNLAVIFAMFLAALVSNRVVAHSSAQQTPKKSTSAQSPTLTPQEKEAQKHYRIALEAIKNNDFATASDELKTAADLAPKNALIWYNLAVVESKKSESAPALEHLQKAESFGLPKSLRNDADQLEARLSYDVKRKAKLDAFSAKLQEFQKEVNEDTVTNTDQGNHADYRHDFTCAYKLTLDGKSISSAALNWDYHEYSAVAASPVNGPANSYHQHYYGEALFSLADFVPDVQITEQHIGFNCGAYAVTAKTERPKSFHVTNGHKGTCSPPPPPGPNPLCDDFSNQGEGTELSIPFRQRDLAEAAAKTLTQLIRMSADIQ
jgi:hypothetical protein